MPLREFTDSTGRRWRVWDIRPEQMHAATRAEDHLQNVINGWLAFESANGDEKRRLAPIPAKWESATEGELEDMLERAESARSEPGVTRRGEASGPGGVTWQSGVGDTTSTARTFRYPNGRYWTVNELPHSSTTSGQRPLLRFTSGARSLDTADWPSEWAQMSEQDLAELLYRSFPRETSGANPTEFRRRRGDLA
jgi:hypothetical protein